MVAGFEDYTPSGIYSPDITPLTTRLFQAVPEKFCGNLCFRAKEEDVWKLTFRHGRVVWAIAGNHRVRRWFCLTNRRCSSPPGSRHQLSLAATAPPWEYQLLMRLLEQNWIERDMVNTIIRQNICEVLFDLVQLWNSEDQLRIEITEEEEKTMEPLIFCGVDELLNDTHLRWQAWCCAQLQTYTPNLAPTIRHAEKLKRKFPEKTYRNLTRMLEEKRSLRELSALMNRDLMGLTQSLLPYERLGLIRFETIADLMIEPSGQMQGAA